MKCYYNVYSELNWNMPEGKVIFFNKKSKFGFIQGEHATNYYVHAKDLLDEVEAEDLVEFEIRIARRGPEAFQVKKKGK